MFEFKKVQKHHLPIILKWRTSEHVAKAMLTTVDPRKHEAWFESIKDRPYWLIYYRDKPIGLISLLWSDREKCHSWGYYVGELSHISLGGLIPPYFYNHVFRMPRVNKLIAEVLRGNSIIKIHELHGYKHLHTKRVNGHAVVVMELDADSWLRDKRFAHFVASFE